VDNGSSDGTADLARRAGAVVITEPKRGYGKAYKTGFSHARGEIIATADADLTYPMEDIPRFVGILDKDNLDFITTNRYGYMEKGAMVFLHRIGNAILSLTTRLLFQINLRDSQSGMWIFKRCLLNEMIVKADSMAFSEELKIEACYFLKCRWKEFPIKYGTRIGKVKLRSWKDGLGNLFHLITKRVNR